MFLRHVLDIKEKIQQIRDWVSVNVQPFDKRKKIHCLELVHKLLISYQNTSESLGLKPTDIQS